MKKTYEKRCNIKRRKRKKQLDALFGDLLLGTIALVLFAYLYIETLERLVR